MESYHFYQAQAGISNYFLYRMFHSRLSFEQTPHFENILSNVNSPFKSRYGSLIISFPHSIYHPKELSIITFISSTDIYIPPKITKCLSSSTSKSSHTQAFRTTVLRRYNGYSCSRNLRSLKSVLPS